MKLSGQFKILLESVKCDFEEISNNIISPKPYIFNLTVSKIVNTIVHQKNQLESEKKWRFLVRKI